MHGENLKLKFSEQIGREVFGPH